MFTQWDGRMLHRRHRVPPLHRTRPGHPPAVPWSINVAAHFPQPAVDGLSARSNTGSADARVFGEYAFFANGPDTHALAIALE